MQKQRKAHLASDCTAKRFVARAMLVGVPTMKIVAVSAFNPVQVSRGTHYLTFIFYASKHNLHPEYPHSTLVLYFSSLVDPRFESGGILNDAFREPATAFLASAQPMRR